MSWHLRSAFPHEPRWRLFRGDSGVNFARAAADWGLGLGAGRRVRADDGLHRRQQPPGRPLRARPAQNHEFHRDAAKDLRRAAEQDRLTLRRSERRPAHPTWPDERNRRDAGCSRAPSSLLKPVAVRRGAGRRKRADQLCAKGTCRHATQPTGVAWAIGGPRLCATCAAMCLLVRAASAPDG